VVGVTVVQERVGEARGGWGMEEVGLVGVGRVGAGEVEKVKAVGWGVEAGHKSSRFHT
jgi:hypothetical protein